MELAALGLVVVYLLVNVLVGVAACFAGRRLFFVMLGALVFLGVFNVALGATDASPASLAVAAVLGVVAALLSRYAYKAAVFLVGFCAGAALGFVAAVLLPQEVTDYLPLVMAIAGVVVGLAGVRWSDAIVRWGTAWSGASFAVPSLLAAILGFDALLVRAVPGDAMATFDALSSYVGGEFASSHGTAILACTVVLAVAGAIVQSRSRD